MIYVTQGHQNGVGLEVFFKSLLCLPTSEIKYFKLFAYKEDCELTLKSLLFEYSFNEHEIIFNTIKLKVHWLKDTGIPHSTGSLFKALIETEKDKGILLTLPTSKDQIVDPYRPSLSLAGHTEFFRHFYHNDNISMLFHGGKLNTLLITDHYSLKDFLNKISSQLIIDKVSTTLDSYPEELSQISNVYLSGINPHVGESGLLGDEDRFVFEAKKILQKKYPTFHFHGPYSADTMIFHHENCRSLFVYMFHDQGLGVFKALNRYIGINISVGMPILRMSVDHGTAFDQFGKNHADYSGCLYLLEKAIKIKKARKNAGLIS